MPIASRPHSPDISVSLVSGFIREDPGATISIGLNCAFQLEPNLVEEVENLSILCYVYCYWTRQVAGRYDLNLYLGLLNRSFKDARESVNLELDSFFIALPLPFVDSGFASRNRLCYSLTQDRCIHPTNSYPVHLGRNIARILTRRI